MEWHSMLVRQRRWCVAIVAVLPFSFSVSASNPINAKNKWLRMDMCPLGPRIFRQLIQCIRAENVNNNAINCFRVPTHYSYARMRSHILTYLAVCVNCHQADRSVAERQSRRQSIEQSKIFKRRLWRREFNVQHASNKLREYVMHHDPSTIA